MFIVIRNNINKIIMSYIANARAAAYRTLCDTENKSRSSLRFESFITWLIIANLFALVLERIPTFYDGYEDSYDLFDRLSIYELTWFLVPLQKRGFLIIFYLKGVLNMAKGQRLKPEQIVTLLRQIDVLTTNGKTLAQACKEVGTVEQSYYRWRKIYGGMKVDQAKKYKELEQENTRLKKLVADLSLREVMLKEVIKGNF